MSLSYLQHLADYSDGVLYVLAVLLLLALAVILDRFWYLRRTILGGQSVVRQISQQTALGAAELDALRQRAVSLPEAALLTTVLEHLDLPTEVLSDLLDEVIILLESQIDRRMWVLDTIVTLAPLLGLFGTIIGMFHAFSVLATPGHAPVEITAGVADALVATASGIFIAMLGLAAFNALTDRVRLVLLQLETVKIMVLNRVSIAAVRSAGSDARPRALRAMACGE